MELYDFLRNMIPLIILHKKSKISQTIRLLTIASLYFYAPNNQMSQLV